MIAFESTAGRPALFFKRTCPPCQWMSRLAVIFTAGLVRRVPIDSAEARELYRRFPEHEGQLVLMEPHRVTFGRRVFLAAPRVIVSAPFFWLAQAVHTLVRDED